MASFGNFDGYWVFLDWANLYRTNFSGVLNLMYLQARCDWATAICLIIDDESAAARYTEKAAALVAAVEKILLRPPTPRSGAMASILRRTPRWTPFRNR